MVDGTVKINWLSAYHVHSQMRTVKLFSGSIQILKIARIFWKESFFNTSAAKNYINAKLHLVVSSLHTQWEKQFCSGAGHEVLVPLPVVLFWLSLRRAKGVITVNGLFFLGGGGVL